MPSHNFGLYPALSLSIWFKPSPEAGSRAKILDFSTISAAERLFMGRSPAGDGVQVAVVRRNETVDLSVDGGEWEADVWKHLVWVLSPTTRPNATWNVYINSELKGSQDAGTFPAAVEYIRNYIAKSNALDDGAYFGFLDSFFIFPSALDAAEVNYVYKVRSVCAFRDLSLFACDTPGRWFATE